MKAKEYMQHVAKAERELKLITAKRRHFQDLAESMGGGMGTTAAKPSGASRVECAAVALADLTTELDVKAAEYTAMIRKAEGLINKLPQEKFRQVLTYKYLVGMSWKSISDEMKYQDEKSVFRTHGYALRELQKLL